MAAQTLEEFLVAWTSIHLNKGLPVKPTETLSMYGITSIKALLLAEDTQNLFGFEWPPYLFFQDLTIAELAEEGNKMMEEI
ncbi:MAG: acyl carrier protein [Bacteroidetes bacterium]|nr:acyl carrier protein [Bacteroidota bacterium]